MKLDYGKVFLLGFGFFGVSVVWATYNAFVPIFLSERFNLSASVVGVIMTLDNIAALFIQPPIGTLSDRTRTRIGRRMPFIVVGAPIAAVAFGVLPLAGLLPVFMASAGTMLLAMAVFRTPVVALMPDLVPSQFRSQANGVINLMGGVGAIIAFLVGGRLYKLNPAYPFWLGGVLIVASTLLLFLVIREPKEYPQDGAGEGTFMGNLRTVIADRDRSALMMLLAIFFWFLGFTAIEAFFTLYGKNHLGIDESDGALLLALLSLVFVIFAIPAGQIGARIGRRTTIVSGIVIMSLTMLAMFFTPVDVLNVELFKLPVLGAVPVIGVALMVAGLGWAAININSLPMVVDMAPQSRLGTYTGLYYLFSTFSAIVGPISNGWIIDLTGRNYNSVMIVAPIFMGLALLCMMGVRRGEAVLTTIEPISAPAN